mgnify:CR=1 FL=1
MMRGYYAGGLSGERLRRCYEIASPRVKRYLEAEILFLLGRISPSDSILELGCGYGRVAYRLAKAAGRVVGIDNAAGSIELARRLSPPGSRCEFLEMDALELAFRGHEFEKVVCVQNGISAFGVEMEPLMREALRVTRPGGRLYFSTYSERFWEDRLRWFEAQAAEGLVGEIDREKTGDGVIVCRDGFRSGLVTPEEFLLSGERLGLKTRIKEVDGSSLFCEMKVPEVR